MMLKLLSSTLPQAKLKTCRSSSFLPATPQAKEKEMSLNVLERNEKQLERIAFKNKK
jgi:hypothetical protein